ncbi:PD-(D/E)XK nuclease family protein [Coraliomargarita sp. W4R72]
MPTITSHSLDWNQQLLPAVTERLLSFTEGSLLDLSHLLVIVPTRQSGRRLREALAVAIQDKGLGLLPPDIITPDTLLSRPLKNAPIANEASVTAAWVDVLSTIDPQHFEAIFPISPEQSAGWQFGMAQRIMQVRDELGEEGLGLYEAAQLAAESGNESERWRELARLEALYIDQLNLHQLADPKQARREAADQFTAPAGIERILLIATPDAQALPLKALDNAMESVPIEVWTYGDANYFDSWGRPLTEFWNQRALDFEGWNCQLKANPEPKVVVSEVAAMTANAKPESILIGLADSDLAPLLADELTRQNIPHYDPEGTPVHLGGIGRLTELLCQLSQEANIATVRTLLQHPDFFAYIKASDSQKHLLRKLDQCFEQHLCADLDALIHFTDDARLRGALKALKGLLFQIQQDKHFSHGLSAALKAIYADVEVDTGETSKPWRERAEAVRKLISEVATAEETFSKLNSTLARSLVLQGLSKAKVHPDRPRHAHDLLGWLELLWNDAPQLVLVGLNEGKVPESVVGDAFLPETQRETFGLRTNEQRFARDAYLMEALCRRRAGALGQVDIFAPQKGADGSPVKPSRLLFLGTPDTLLPRTRKLFAQAEENEPPTDYSIPWKLSPPAGLPMPERISVSALKSYLECPFRFFLRHIMRMRPIDVESREMSPAAFGTLLHAILAELKGLTLDSQTQASDLIAKLHAIADNEIEKQFGRQLSFALRLQKEAILARIQAFVERQIEDVQANGSIQILDTESKFSAQLEGLELRGIIDRIDQRGDRIELIDYKTADSPKTPEKAHLATVARKEPPAHLPEEAIFEHEGKRYRWIDLQLPLYVHSQLEPGKERPSVAYVNLAKTLEKSEIARWENFTQSHIDSALACAEAVIRQIKAGIFWPPNPDVREDYDDFAPLFPDGIENSVEPEAFKNYQFAEKMKIETE